jgi:hypothetical protein
MARLEATNAVLRAELSYKNSHIAMLEEKLFKMSVELASSHHARKDGQKLIHRRSTQVTMMSEDDDDFMVPADLMDDSSTSAQVRQISSSSSSSSSNYSRFNLMSSKGPQDDFNDSSRSLGSTGIGGFKGNMIKLDRSDTSRSEDLSVDFPMGRRRSAIGNFITNLDRSDRSEDLSVNFPKRGRRTMMNRTTVNSHSQEQRRVTVVGQLFRLRKCELKVDDEEQPNSPQHQKPNPKLRRVSSRVIGSTVIFPREDDDYSLGFE